MRIASWNVNSAHVRLPLILRFLKQYNVDVLCLQETKCENALFPLEEIEKLGYTHFALNGQKAYHGVAIISRLPFMEQQGLDFCGRQDSRHISVVFRQGGGKMAGVSLHNFYVPAGGDEPDPSINPKFSHKLAFLEEMKTCSMEMRRSDPDGLRLLVGDLNIAPLETDVWSHKQLLNVVSHTSVECEALQAILGVGWVDVIREHIQPDLRIYTWWSYRARDWVKSNRGRRLDHIWASPKLAESTRRVEVIREARGWERPSDHVPLIAEFA